MVARWDVLLIAAVLSGGSMLIENSHRVDTGLADAPAGAVLPACAEPAAGGGDTASNTRFVVHAADDDAALSACD